MSELGHSHSSIATMDTFRLNDELSRLIREQRVIFRIDHEALRQSRSPSRDDLTAMAQPSQPSADRLMSDQSASTSGAAEEADPVLKFSVLNGKLKIGDLNLSTSCLKVVKLTSPLELSGWSCSLSRNIRMLRGYVASTFP
jgi:hypothetical protein